MTESVNARSFSRLPAVRVDRGGRRHVDLRAVMALALPLMLNSAVQMVLNLTDTWFIGTISTEAMAAMGAVHFLAIVFLLGLGGVGLAVQTFVAQAYGARLGRNASRSTWQGLWATLLLAPLFLVVAASGPLLLSPFGLNGDLVNEAVRWWMPRMLGGPFAVALWALSGFFNGLGRTRVTLLVMLAVAIANAALNAAFIFGLGLGIAGSAWATTLSLAFGCALLAWMFLSPAMQHPYWTRVTWRPNRRRLRRILSVGIPTGVFPAVDLVAISLFQLMQVRLGVVQGAATQIVMMLTSIAYLPAIGIAIAGTTLVGQSIGAGDKAWAQRMGNTIILIAACYMGAIGAAIALGGSWLVPVFADPSHPGAADVIRLARKLVWIAGAYQVFDALNLAAAFCLRGAGDVRTPTTYLLVLAWLGFVPLAHMFSFAPGEGWVTFLPQFGWGTVGGWWASLIYICVLGVVMWARWRSGAWRRIRLT
ncbi:MAG: MATE family efflux transporter [Betaproteobacteria bacterium]|nr:MATE family efflux transporter [Betaproteobacteria bacterium]